MKFERCLHCGSSNIREIMSTGTGPPSIKCMNCGSTSPRIETWNNRVSLRKGEKIAFTEQEYSYYTKPFAIKTICRREIIKMAKEENILSRKLQYINDETMRKIAIRMEEAEDYTSFWDNLIEAVNQEVN